MLKILFSSLLLVSILAFAAEPGKKLEKAPEWELQNESGETISSADFAGKPLVIHFWATWCPYCKKLQPGLDKLYREYSDQGLQMIAISFWEDEGATPQASLDERGHSFKTLVNGDHVARNLFGVKGTPTTVFIDKQGNIVAKTRISDPNDERLEKVVQLLVK